VSDAGPIRTLNLCGQCHRPVRLELTAATTTATCGACTHAKTLEPGAVGSDGALLHCPWCGCPELYRQRDFHQTVGCAIMVVAAVASVIVHYWTGDGWWLAVLGAGVALDAVIYWIVPDRGGCYVCHAEFRAVPNLEAIPGYDLHVATRIEYTGPRKEHPAGFTGPQESGVPTDA
jgi:hypothetical protein